MSDQQQRPALSGYIADDGIARLPGDEFRALLAERDRLREDVGTLEGLVAQLRAALDRVIDDNTSARQALATIADQQSGVWGQIAHDALNDRRQADSDASTPDTSPPEGSSSADAP